MRSTLEETFNVAKVREIISKVLQDVLTDKKYSALEAGKWTREITDTINQEVRELQLKRYKNVVQVFIGQQSGAGCKYIAKAFWDNVNDELVSEQFVNSHLFCSVAVFGIRA